MDAPALLRAAIEQSGRVEGNLLIVDGFLNHRVDVGLVHAVGAWFAAGLGGVDAVVTCEASGIPPAFATAAALGVPLVYAKKRPTPRPGSLVRQVRSATKGDRPWVELRPGVLDGIGTAAVIDDFLSGGHTASALASLLQEAGVTVSQMGFVIEKRFTGGRALLEGEGRRVVAAVTVTGFEDGRPVFA
jgi:xanthine phosphoribosyltransferase